MVAAVGNIVVDSSFRAQHDVLDVAETLDKQLSVERVSHGVDSSRRFGRVAC